MKAIKSRCSRCNAAMVLENHGNYSSLSCPYCGNSQVLMESDNVKVAQLRANTELTGMEYRYREHHDYLDFAKSRRKAQTIVICIFAVIAVILICVYLSCIL